MNTICVFQEQAATNGGRCKLDCGMKTNGRCSEIRPRKRGDCEDGIRPCPWVGCRYHLVWDYNSMLQKFKSNRISDDELLEILFSMPYTCALDLAGKGGATLQEVATTLAMTRERVRQLTTRGGEITINDKGAAEQPTPSALSRITGQRKEILKEFVDFEIENKKTA